MRHTPRQAVAAVMRSLVAADPDGSSASQGLLFRKRFETSGNWGVLVAESVVDSPPIYSVRSGVISNYLSQVLGRPRSDAPPSSRSEFDLQLADLDFGLDPTARRPSGWPVLETSDVPVLGWVPPAELAGWLLPRLQDRLAELSRLQDDHALRDELLLTAGPESVMTLRRAALLTWRFGESVILAQVLERAELAYRARSLHMAALGMTGADVRVRGRDVSLWSHGHFVAHLRKCPYGM